MRDDKAWDRITDAIDSRFGIIGHGRSTEALPDHTDLTQYVAFITFERDAQTYKLERVAGPAIIDRKTFGAKRIGSDVRYENVYDASETSYRTNLYRQEGGEWVSIDPGALGL